MSMSTRLKGAAVTGALALGASVVIAAPAQAHTVSSAIANGCGSGYSIVKDGQRTLKTSSGKVYGYVYLTYNPNNGYNCVVTRKTAYHGTPSKTLARIAVLNRDGSQFQRQDWANYSHFAAIKAYGKGKCVAYWGDIRNPSGTVKASNGRWKYGNCG
ncbi:hypothetical protein [Janibacter sp. G368]|uniref:hypothetical protein n=1 Tax=Janibacter sp. G368 TaxID=3420441 RepID=UPI003D094AEA